MNKFGLKDVILGLAILVVVFGVKMLYAHVVYDDVTCAFSNCVRVR